MAAIKDMSISTKTLLLGVLPSILMFLCLVFFFTSVRMTDARQELMKRGQLIADQLAPACEYGVVSGNTQAIQKIIDETIVAGNVYTVRVRDNLGETLTIAKAKNAPMYSEESLIRFTADIIQQPVSLELDDFDKLNTLYAFDQGVTKVGSIEVSIASEILSEQQMHILLTTVFVGATLLMLTFILVRIMAHGIAQPIEKLTEIVQLIGGGDYKARATIRTGGEIGQLATSINRLVQHLELSQQSQEETLQRLTTAHQTAENASKAKSEFLALMSHELRTPLNGILGMLQILEDNVTTSDQRHCVGIAIDSTEHLLTIINDILDFSRIERGKLTLDPVEFNVKQLIEEIATTFRHMCEEKGLSFDTEYAGDLMDATVVGDPTRLRQILVNLLSNAIKFTQAGYVKISARWETQGPEKLRLHVNIEDSGIGIAEDELKRMFDSFSQVDQFASRRFGGTGLGLSIARRLLALMDGTIEVESQEGEGSCFRIQLDLHYRMPLRDTIPEAPARPSVESENALPQSGFSNSLALVVEDNQVNQQVACRILEKLGLAVDQAFDGQEALDKFAHRKYDIIFMDCQMPIKDGFESSRAIRELERERGSHPVPIIALTANVMDGIEQLCEDAGMDGYIPKPVKKSQLAAILRLWLFPAVEQ